MERKRYFRKFASPMITKRSFWGHLVELVCVNYESSISQEEGEESAEKLTARESASSLRGRNDHYQRARSAGYSQKWPGEADSQAFRSIQRKRPKILDDLGLTVDAILRRLKASENT